MEHHQYTIHFPEYPEKYPQQELTPPQKIEKDLLYQQLDELRKQHNVIHNTDLVQAKILNQTFFSLEQAQHFASWINEYIQQHQPGHPLHITGVSFHGRFALSYDEKGGFARAA